MPPHERFTANLLETLASSRLKLNDYVERKKSEVDRDVEEYNKKLSQEEENIRTRKETLKAVQEERGLSSEEGIAQRREQLSVERNLLEERVHALQEEARKQELSVEGEQHAWFCSTVLKFTLSLLTVSKLRNRAARRGTSLPHQGRGGHGSQSSRRGIEKHDCGRFDSGYHQLQIPRL